MHVTNNYYYYGTRTSRAIRMRVTPNTRTECSQWWVDLTCTLNPRGQMSVQAIVPHALRCISCVCDMAQS